jgi:hypothetical protein
MSSHDSRVMSVQRSTGSPRSGWHRRAEWNGSETARTGRETPVRADATRIVYGIVPRET